IRQNPIALGVILDLVEEHRRPVLAPRHQLGDRSDLEIPITLLEGLDLLQPFRLADPFPQIPVFHNCLPFLKTKLAHTKTVTNLAKFAERVKALRALLRKVRFVRGPASCAKSNRRRSGACFARPKQWGVAQGLASFAESNRPVGSLNLHDWCFRLAQRAPSLYRATEGSASEAADVETKRFGLSTAPSAAAESAFPEGAIASILRDAFGGERRSGTAEDSLPRDSRPTQPISARPHFLTSLRGGI